MPLPQPSDFIARPLPPNLFPLTAPAAHAAYNMCLSLESRAPLVVLPSEKHPSVLLCARVLGFTLIEAPIRDHIVNTHGSDHTLLALGKYYIQRLIRLFKLVPSPMMYRTWKLRVPPDCLVILPYSRIRYLGSRP